MFFTTVLVDLDSILDTRLSSLYLRFPDQIEKILSIYPYRLSDDYPGLIDYNGFLDLYKNRDKNTLFHSSITPIVYLLKSFVLKSLENLAQSINPAPPKILLNIYPYVLKDNEVQTIIQALLNVVTPTVDIEVVNMSDQEITPSFLKSNIQIYFKYNYFTWLDEVTNVNKDWDDKCPSVKFIVPSILPIEAKNLKKTFKINGIDVDPFKYFQLALSSIMDIEFVKLSYYNVLTLDDNESNDDSEANASESSESDAATESDGL